MTFDAIVIGGGLAGCSVARQLAQRGFEVCLLEKATYPRHKLCGEFLSPEARKSFQTLGLLEAVAGLDPAPMDRARLTAPSGATSEHALPEPAWGLSRYQLDGLLFRAAQAAGVDGRPNTRATAVHGSLGDVATVETTEGVLRGRLVFGAYGRRTRLDRALNRSFLQKDSPYVAFKAHYAGPSVPDAIELHGAPGGYCGVSPVEGDRANVCWIGQVDALKQAGGTPDGMLSHLRQNPALDDRLRGLTRVSERFEAVSQVPLMPKSKVVDGVCMVGDAAGMIAPLCGDGMAMALQAADLVTPLAAGFLKGTYPPAAFQRKYGRAWARTFRSRMRLGRWMHAAAFRPGSARALVHAGRWLPPLARWMIRATRG